MSNTNKMHEITTTNQDLFTNLTREDAEAISGGYEVFTVKNQTKYNIYYYVDGTLATPEFAQPGSNVVWTAYEGGIIEFDTDARNDYQQWTKYDLEHGRVYAFQENLTPGDPWDIDIYDIT